MKRSQLRAARALLSWSQDRLADLSGVSVATIKRIEPGEGSLPTKIETMEKLQRAFENAGVEFTNGGQPGVRFRFVEARAQQRNGDGEWGVLVSWRDGDGAQWMFVPDARAMAKEAGELGDARLQNALRVAADDAERYAAG